MNFTLSEWSDISSIAAAIIAVGALVYTAAQVNASTRVNRAQFWLELRKMFAEHREVHLKLRNGEWSKNLPGDADLERLEAYMGLFEHCEMMLQEGLLDWKTFRAIYGYRVNNILDDLLIVREKLIDRRGGWGVFIKLLRRMEKDIERRRYLSGFWDIDTNKWKLWWGFVEREEGSSYHNTFEALKRDYETKFEELRGREHGLYHSWLMSATEVVSQWPAPPPLPDGGGDEQQVNGAHGDAAQQITQPGRP